MGCNFNVSLVTYSKGITFSAIARGKGHPHCPYNTIIGTCLEGDGGNRDLGLNPGVTLLLLRDLGMSTEPQSASVSTLCSDINNTVKIRMAAILGHFFRASLSAKHYA